MKTIWSKPDHNRETIFLNNILFLIFGNLFRHNKILKKKSSQWKTQNFPSTFVPPIWASCETFKLQVDLPLRWQIVIWSVRFTNLNLNTSLPFLYQKKKKILIGKYVGLISFDVRQIAKLKNIFDKIVTSVCKRKPHSKRKSSLIKSDQMFGKRKPLQIKIDQMSSKRKFHS